MSRAAAAVEAATITSLSHDGRGVTHIDGKAIFVAGALPGEEVQLRRRSRHRSLDEAELVAVEKPSSERVVPRCAAFGVCGGCALQHLEPAAQVRAKREHLFEELRRTGGVEPLEVLEPLVADVWGYRRRARLGAKFVARKGRVIVGFRERLAPYVTDIERCEILASPLDALIAPLATMLTGLSIRARVPQIEVAVADNATALVIRVLEAPTAEDRACLGEFGDEHGVQIYLQPGGVESIVPLTAVVPLTYRLDAFDLELEFQPTDFIQVNGALNRRMVGRAVELLGAGGGDAVLDLFCGLGNFTLPLARRAQSVVGIEGEKSLIERARANARRNGIDNAEFHVANLAATAADLPWADRHFDAVLLDPPRAGAREILPIIAQSGPRRVVYISCHTGSLARDSGILVRQYGFQLRAAGVMDMFAHTAHVESIALFER
jgi:23S rRNA (uracil1939-C5)-methyltransferase